MGHVTGRWVCGSCDRQEDGYVGHVTDSKVDVWVM